MKPTVRFVADIPPEIKKKFQQVASSKERSMKDLLVQYIEKEHKKIYDK